MSSSPDAAGPTMSRRDIVGAMAATAGAFLIPRPAQAMAASRIASTRKLAAVSAGAAYAPKVYTAHEWATVQSLVNYVIPKDATSDSTRTLSTAPMHSAGWCSMMWLTLAAAGPRWRSG